MAASFLINKFIRFYLTEALRSKLFSGQFVIPKSGENVRKFDEFIYPWTQGFFWESYVHLYFVSRG